MKPIMESQRIMSLIMVSSMNLNMKSHHKNRRHGNDIKPANTSPKHIQETHHNQNKTLQNMQP